MQNEHYSNAMAYLVDVLRLEITVRPAASSDQGLRERAEMWRHDGSSHYVYEVTHRVTRRTLVGFYSQGSAFHSDPSPEDILGCLLRDYNDVRCDGGPGGYINEVYRGGDLSFFEGQRLFSELERLEDFFDTLEITNRDLEIYCALADEDISVEQAGELMLNACHGALNAIPGDSLRYISPDLDLGYVQARLRVAIHAAYAAGLENE